MTPDDLRPALLALLRRTPGTPTARVDDALALLAEELVVDVAFLSREVLGRPVVTHTSARPTAAVPRPSAGPGDPSTAEPADVVARVPVLVEGRTWGTLGCAGRAPAERTAATDARDLATLRTVALHLGEVLPGVLGAGLPGAGAAATVGPVDVVDPVGAMAASVAAAGDSVEGLTRPLLELLHQVTKLDSTYLTFVDWEGSTQRIAFALNSGDMVIPEGLVIDWSDTLCRRSLEEGRRYTADVPAVWGDSDAARDLGIVTYVSVPVLDEGDGVVGTLCAASPRADGITPADLVTMDLFARLIGGQLTREAARIAERERAETLERRTGELHALARRDSLTGLLNRAGIDGWLPDALASLRPGRDQLALAYIDLDHFKSVNDTHGHATGDAVLCSLATSLIDVSREGDLLGRLGGDEFVVAAVLPSGSATLGGWTARLRAAASARSGDVLVSASVGVVAVTDGATPPADVLAAADAAMYRDKAARHGAGAARG